MEWRYICGRVSYREMHQYKTLWTWSTYRYGSTDVSRFHMKRGYKAVVRRIDRVRKVLGLKPYILREGV